MPSIYDLMSNVRTRLGDPRSQRPGDMQLLNQVMTQTRVVKRHRRNTGIQWDYNELVIQVVPNNSVYQITQTDFGTPLAVISYAPTLQTWIPRLIPFFGPQNLPYDWGLMNNIAGSAYTPWDGSNCTAQRCAFYWKDNQPYIDFWPLPNLNCEYQVRYLANANGTYDAALTSSPVQPEDADLIEVRASLALLPITEWMSPESKDGRLANAERRRDLSLSLSAEERELTRQFEAAALNFSGPRLHDRWNPCVG